MNRPFYYKEPSICNCMNMRRASHAITNIYDEFLVPSNLNVEKFSLLKHIYQLEPVSVSDLSHVIRLDRTTLVRNLKPLEERNLIRDISAAGSRNRQLELTDEGVNAYKTAELLWEKAQSFIEEYLGVDNIDLLTELLSKIEALVP